MRLLPYVFLLVLFGADLFGRPSVGEGERLAGSLPTDTLPVFYTNPLGKTYYLLPNARLVTDNPLSNQYYSFYDSSLGAPSHVDVTNPFEIIVYYQDYAHLILLDRTLSELQRIDLNDFADLQQAGVVARGVRNEIWVFDDWDFRLKQLDGAGELRAVTNDLRVQLRLTAPPDALLVDGTTVALLQREENRLLVFENTGRFRRTVDLPPADYYGWVAPRLLGLTNDGQSGWLWRTREREAVAFTPPAWMRSQWSPLPDGAGVQLLDSASQQRVYRTWVLDPENVSKN